MKALALVLGAAALVTALLPFQGAAVVALVLAVITALLVEPRTLRATFGLRPLVLAALAASLTAVAVAWTGGTTRGAAVGGAVFLRLLVLVLVTAVASRHLDAEGLQALAERLRLPRLGLAFGLALNSLPHLAEASRDAWIALSIRSRRRRPRLRDLPRLAETLLAHTGRVAEEAAAAAALRGHPALTTPLLGAGRVPHIVAVVGRSGSGKTPALARCITALQERGAEVYGFVQPAERGPEGKSGFRIRDVRTGREAPLARRVDSGSGEHGTPFVFDAAGFALAGAALAGGSRGAILVVDELGPVELRGAGHWPAVRRTLARRAPAVVLLGVRKQLVAAFLNQLEADTAVVVDVETSTDPVRDVLAAIDGVLPPRTDAGIS